MHAYQCAATRVGRNGISARPFFSTEKQPGGPETRSTSVHFRVQALEQPEMILVCTCPNLKYTTQAKREAVPTDRLEFLAVMKLDAG